MSISKEKWERRFLVYVMDGRISFVGLWMQGNPRVTLLPWIGVDVPPPLESSASIITSEEDCEVRAFVSSLINRQDVPLPPVFGMTVGVTLPERRMIVEQMCPAFVCPFLESHAEKLLPLIRRACKPYSEVSPEDRRWTLRYKKSFLMLDQ